jgi:hexosaminidase
MFKVFYHAAIMVCLMSAATAAVRAEKAAVIPQPTELELLENAGFVISSDTRIAVSGDTKRHGEYLAEKLRPATGFDLDTKWRIFGTKGTIALELDEDLAELGDEGYSFESGPDGILISARKPAGVFYGIQTLLQLLPPEIYGEDQLEGIEWAVPGVRITDIPRFQWRGLMLDSSRHFMPLDFVKKFIDLLALHKMNTFHWHLTDDQGWRVEIKAYPKLTEIGAHRDETLIGHGGRPPFEYDGQPHGGYYTQEQLREIVEYAKDRFITVVPEIEMPGHAMAAIASYPELSCHGNQIEVAKRWGVMPDIFCAGKDEVFDFLQQVLVEVMDIFPSEFIHVGGDEAPKGQWQKCPLCQARIKEEGLKDEHELQSYFITRMEKFLSSHGRRLIGWDEILEGGLAPGATVMSWRGENGAIAAARSGHDAVMAPTTYTYFDYYQGPSAGQPLAIGGNLPLDKVYSFNPIPAELNAEEAKHILGVQGQLWSEYLKTPSHTEYMAFPRACALAEVAWSQPEDKDFESFHGRLLRHKRRLDELDVNHYPIPPISREIGKWSSGQTSEEWATMEWSIDGAVDAAGDYLVTLLYTAGEHRLDIQKVELLRDGNVLSTDQHEGETGSVHRNNQYRLKVPTGDLQGLSIRAVVRSDGGSDSNGVVKLHRAE